jgi:ATP-dependent Clp protease ATP-binding subunit ClpX
LDKKALLSVLSEPKNSIVKQYTKLFAIDGIALTFSPDVLEYIVDKAIEFKLGARGLRSITESIMMDAMYNFPSKSEKELHITLEYAKNQLEKANINRLKES